MGEFGQTHSTWANLGFSRFGNGKKESGDLHTHQKRNGKS